MMPQMKVIWREGKLLMILLGFGTMQMYIDQTAAPSRNQRFSFNKALCCSSSSISLGASTNVDIIRYSAWTGTMCSSQGDLQQFFTLQGAL